MESNKRVSKTKPIMKQQPTLQEWDKHVADDIKVMKDMLDRIEELMKKHLNGQEKYLYIKPVKEMIVCCWEDLVENGVAFTEQ